MLFPGPWLSKPAFASPVRRGLRRFPGAFRLRSVPPLAPLDRQLGLCGAERGLCAPITADDGTPGLVFGRRGRSIRYEGQRNELRALKDEAPFLREVPHHVLQE